MASRVTLPANAWGCVSQGYPSHRHVQVHALGRCVRSPHALTGLGPTCGLPDEKLLLMLLLLLLTRLLLLRLSQEDPLLLLFLLLHTNHLHYQHH